MCDQVLCVFTADFRCLQLISGFKEWFGKCWEQKKKVYSLSRLKIIGITTARGRLAELSIGSGSTGTVRSSHFWKNYPDYILKRTTR